MAVSADETDATAVTGAAADGESRGGRDAGYLTACLRVLEERLAWMVDAVAEVEPGSTNDPLRGLYLSGDYVAGLFSDSARRLWAAGPDASKWPDAATAAGAQPALWKLATTFALSELDVGILLAALAPDIDARFERWYGYLNDDVTMRRATVRLALQLNSASLVSGEARARFGDSSPLVAGGLLEVRDTDRPLLTRGLRVPDRVSAFLLGDDRLDDGLTGWARLAVPAPYALPMSHQREVERLRASARRNDGTVYVAADEEGAALDVAIAALATEGTPVIVLQPLPAPPTGTGPGAVPPMDFPVIDAVREARLRGCALVAAATVPATGWEPAEGPGAPVPMVFTGTGAWDKGRGPVPDVQVRLDMGTKEERTQLWQQALAARSSLPPAVEQPGSPDPSDDPDLAAALGAYRLSPARIASSAKTASRHSTYWQEPLDARHVAASVRAHNGGALERLARCVLPESSWADLLLPEDVARQLRHLADRARHRERVLGQWRMRPGGMQGNGVAALFSGDSGTGKTLAAEVLAGELGLPLYVVDLSTVVDKYIGETEKHLDRIFTEAAGINGVLLFDEADALFGKRSETRDAHDRYANIEVSYLLQRIEHFDGLVVMTTNLYGNIDEAFCRRLDAVVHFPLPDAEQRRALWDHCLGPVVPRAPGLRLDELARAFELAGGSIRACVLAAAYRSAATDLPVTNGDLADAVRAEYRKMRRLIREEAFRDWAGSAEAGS
ncbi:ATP-binding protein [Streptomyces sp. NPDC092307]|uniref:ATP-binding protein n=1 Tax=Streptomyces sp. NPDC092307 TaxID=3366013 RepID=UPI0037FBB48A